MFNYTTSINTDVYLPLELLPSVGFSKLIKGIVFQCPLSVLEDFFNGIEFTHSPLTPNEGGEQELTFKLGVRRRLKNNSVARFVGQQFSIPQEAATA